MSQLTIIRGPSLFKLMVSVFNGDSGHRQPVKLNFADNPEIWVMIDGVDREDGSGESWLFRGFTARRDGELSKKVAGYYSTKTRKGWMKFV